MYTVCARSRIWRQQKGKKGRLIKRKIYEEGRFSEDCRWRRVCRSYIGRKRNEGVK